MNTDKEQNTNDSPKVKEVFYFGCMGQSGHYLFEPGERSSRRVLSGIQSHHLDGPFCPPTDWPTGKWMLSMKPPWTIISWWDNSVDGRPGSHSTFVFQGYEVLEEFWTDARRGFPSVFGRQPFPSFGAGVFTPPRMVDDLVRCMAIFALSGTTDLSSGSNGEITEVMGYSAEQHKRIVEHCRAVITKHRLEQWATAQNGTT